MDDPKSRVGVCDVGEGAGEWGVGVGGGDAAAFSASDSLRLIKDIYDLLSPTPIILFSFSRSSSPSGV